MGETADSCPQPLSKNPYDAFFKSAFSDPEAAADLIRNFLPASYTKNLSESEISVEIKDYINRHLKEHQSDLLVTCRSQERQVRFYFLLEHKSSPERDTLLQVGRYLFELMYELLEKDHEKPEGPEVSLTPSSAKSRWLPEIVPIIIYHGTRNWNYSQQFVDHIDCADERAAHLLRFQPVFVNLQSYKDELFTGSLRAVVSLMLLKNLSRRLDQQSARKLLDAMYANPVPYYLREFYYRCYEALFQVKSKEEIDMLFDEFDKAGYTEEKEKAMTFAEVLEQRGKEEGRVEGEHITLIRQLDKKFGVSEEEKELVRQTKDLNKIEAALDEILDAASKAQVLAHLSGFQGEGEH